MPKELSEEQLRRCRARAKANKSSLEQEVFLERGGSLQQWYGLLEGTGQARLRPPSKEVIEARMRSCAFRMTEELMTELGSRLKKREILALCKAAHIIALEPDAVVRADLERQTIDMAFDMVASGK